MWEWSMLTSRVRGGSLSSSPTEILSFRHMIGFSTASSLSRAHGSSAQQ